VVQEEPAIGAARLDDARRAIEAREVAFEGNITYVHVEPRAHALKGAASPIVPAQSLMVSLRADVGPTLLHRSMISHSVASAFNEGRQPAWVVAQHGEVSSITPARQASLPLETCTQPSCRPAAGFATTRIQVQ
jgi:hypothetical protein